jgi:hypothetical protein
MPLPTQRQTTGLGPNPFLDLESDDDKGEASDVEKRANPFFSLPGMGLASHDAKPRPSLPEDDDNDDCEDGSFNMLLQAMEDATQELRTPAPLPSQPPVRPPLQLPPSNTQQQVPVQRQSPVLPPKQQQQPTLSAAKSADTSSPASASAAKMFVQDRPRLRASSVRAPELDQQQQQSQQQLPTISVPSGFNPFLTTVLAPQNAESKQAWAVPLAAVGGGESSATAADKVSALAQKMATLRQAKEERVTAEQLALEQAEVAAIVAEQEVAMRAAAVAAASARAATAMATLTNMVTLTNTEQQWRTLEDRIDTLRKPSPVFHAERSAIMPAEDHLSAARLGTGMREALFDQEEPVLLAMAAAAAGIEKSVKDAAPPVRPSAEKPAPAMAQPDPPATAVAAAMTAEERVAMLERKLALAMSATTGRPTERVLLLETPRPPGISLNGGRRLLPLPPTQGASTRGVEEDSSGC